LKPPRDHEIEQRALGRGKWVNLFMGVVGVSAALVSHASALMLDGLFSAVNFMAAIFAARVAQRISRSPDSMRPFGYEIEEAVYVMFRALVLVGIILVAAWTAVDKILVYAGGGELLPVKLDWVIGYVLLMALTCFSLSHWYRRNWLRTERRSALLHTERTGAIIDGVLSLAAGVAFVVISALKNTSLDFLVPVSDSIVVLALAIYMIPKPIALFRGAMKEVVGEPDDMAIAARFSDAARTALKGGNFELLHADLVKVGRSRFGAVYLKPVESVTAEDIDAVRNLVSDSCRQAMADIGPIRIECLFRGEAPNSAG
jgi:predicted Co/Zn/Cd cation transporter (cation efflux family)